MTSRRRSEAARPRRLRLAGALIAAAAAALVADRAAATPPQPDDVVETRLAPATVKAQVAALRLRQQAPPAQRRGDARRLIERARSEGDLRLLGYAEARLAGLPDAEALTLRATVAQAQHRFADARALLDQALRDVPRHPQALLTRASVALVQGQYDAARADCRALGQLAPEPATICSAAADAMTGADTAALRTLQRLADTAPPVRAWALSLAGEILLQQDEVGRAVAVLRASLAAADDLYTRVLLAESLMLAGRAAEVEPLLAEAPPTDAVLLRRWQARRALGADATALEEALAARLAQDTARGQPVHLREAAQFALERGDAATALALARANWARQRERADAWLLAAAARRAGDAPALQQLRAWHTETGRRDIRLARLLEGAPQGGA